MLTSQLGFEQSAGKGGVAARSQAVPGLWIFCCPLPQFTPQRRENSGGTGVCLHVLLLVPVLIGSSWGAAPPPASALTPPTAREQHGKAMSPVGLSDVRRDPQSEQRQRLPPALFTPSSPQGLRRNWVQERSQPPIRTPSPVVLPTSPIQSAALPFPLHTDTAPHQAPWAFPVSPHTP